MDKWSEKPGACTPWQAINQLLNVDERLEVQRAKWRGYLFAPKKTSTLSALLYVLKEQRLAYAIEGQGPLMSQEDVQVLVSARSFCQIDYLEDDCVEVGASCRLSTLHSQLFEWGYEIGWEDLTFQGSRTLAEALLMGVAQGIVLRQAPLAVRLLAAEMILPDGGVLKWGRGLRGATDGPPLSQLLWGMGHCPAILIKVMLKVDLIPPKRLFLSWSFSRRQELWEHFRKLDAFTSTWERLDCVLSGSLAEKAFILAQISGLEEELAAFKLVCPGFLEAKQENKAHILKNFFYQRGYAFYPIEAKKQLPELQLAQYYWHQGLIDQGYLIAKELPTGLILGLDATSAQLWKERLRSGLIT